jgi:hypothetical protein
MMTSNVGDEPRNPLPNGVSSKWRDWKTGDKGNRQAEAFPPLPLIGDAMVRTKKYRRWRLSASINSGFQTRHRLYPVPF